MISPPARIPCESLEPRLLLSNYVIQTLGQFGGTSGVPSPTGDLFITATGAIDGTAERGGPSRVGSIFSLPNGSTTPVVIARFNGKVNGVTPSSGLVEDATGDFFGTTIYSALANHGNLAPTAAHPPVGDGTIFELPAGTNTPITLADFDGADGQTPEGTLVMDSAGNLYGVTFAGGANNEGGVFELVNGSNTITLLASFDGTNGQNPSAGLIIDSAGDVFGTTQQGGASGDGTIFEVAHGSGTITALASFNGTNGSSPLGALMLDSTGDLFGTASAGGTFDDGTVFELPAGSGTIDPLASFNGIDGIDPRGALVMDSSGNLLGTTHGGGPTSDGTVFEVAAGSNAITQLGSFAGINGALPQGGLFMSSSGNIYGATTAGGANGVGTLFRIVPGGTAANPGVFTVAPGSTTLPPVVIAGTLLQDSADVVLHDRAADSGPVTIDLYASSDQQIDPTSILLERQTFNVNQSAGTTYVLTLGIRELSSTVPAGDYSLRAEAVDSFGNTAFATAGPGFEVVPPEISLSETIAKLTLPSTDVSGSKTNAVATLNITNEGNVADNFGLLTIELFASPDGLVSDGTLINAKDRLPLISVGQTIQVNVPLNKIPPGLDGSFYIVALVIDPMNHQTTAVSASTFEFTPPIVPLTALATTKPRV